MKRFTKEPVKGFLRAKGREIVNEAGERIILCGWGIGNWMNPEGFMVSGLEGAYGFTDMAERMQNNIRFDRQRTIHENVRELCGTAYQKTFWQRWYRAFLAEEDIWAMAGMGYNSLRLVLESSGLLDEEPGIHFNEESFQMLDQVLDWCEEYGLYAVLDMHSTPGGHSGVSCDNGIDNMPHMLLEPESRERTILLWEKIAQRYRDRFIVAGYELLNEPISPPHLHYLEPELRAFYEETIRRVRTIDKKHMFFIQPPAFSHKVSFLDRGFDPECHNWCYVIHLYSFEADMKSFYHYIEPSYRLNVPCWLGEGRSDYQAMAGLLEMQAEYGIGYNLFVYKYMETVDEADCGLISYPRPEGWDRIMNYIKEGGPRPSYEESQRLMDAWIEACRFEHGKIRQEMIPYTFRSQGMELSAVVYDRIGGDGISYHGTWREGNPYSYRTEDQIKMVIKPGGEYPQALEGFGEKTKPTDNLLVELREGEFVNYTVYRVSTDCAVSMKARGLEASKVRIRSGELTEELMLDKTEEMKRYPLFCLEPGDAYTISIQVLSGVVQLETIYFPK